MLFEVQQTHLQVSKFSAGGADNVRISTKQLNPTTSGGCSFFHPKPCFFYINKSKHLSLCMSVYVMDFRATALVNSSI